MTKPVAVHSDARVARTPAEAVKYGVLEILGSIDYWIILGVVVSALITIFIPPGYLSTVSWINGIPGMLLVLAISVPLYVCTTGSVPIAAGLVAAGMPLGAALVFLMAGPATNVATIGAVYRALGGKVLAVYLGVITSFSMAFGLLFGSILPDAGGVVSHIHHQGASVLETGSAILVTALLAFLLLRRLSRYLEARKNRPRVETDALRVKGMTCTNCVRHVEEAVGKLDGVTGVRADLATGILQIEGKEPDRKELERAISESGYGLE